MRSQTEFGNEVVSGAFNGIRGVNKATDNWRLLLTLRFALFFSWKRSFFHSPNASVRRAPNSSCRNSNIKKSGVSFPLCIVLEIKLDRERLVLTEGFVYKLHYCFRVAGIPLPLAHSIARNNNREKGLARPLEGRRKQVFKLAHSLDDILRWHALIVGRHILPADSEQMRIQTYSRK